VQSWWEYSAQQLMLSLGRQKGRLDQHISTHQSNHLEILELLVLVMVLRKKEMMVRVISRKVHQTRKQLAMGIQVQLLVAKPHSVQREKFHHQLTRYLQLRLGYRKLQLDTIHSSTTVPLMLYQTQDMVLLDTRLLEHQRTVSMSSWIGWPI
jgi:hypothetical protein